MWQHLLLLQELEIGKLIASRLETLLDFEMETLLDFEMETLLDFEMEMLLVFVLVLSLEVQRQILSEFDLDLIDGLRQRAHMGEQRVD